MKGWDKEDASGRLARKNFSAPSPAGEQPSIPSLKLCRALHQKLQTFCGTFSFHTFFHSGNLSLQRQLSKMHKPVLGFFPGQRHQ